MDSQIQGTVLLTGVAGFIGHKTAQLLLENNYHVVGIDNLSDYYDVRLKQYRLQVLKNLQNGNFEFNAMNIEDSSLLEGMFQKYKFAAVINLAARAGVRYSMEQPKLYMETNATGSLNLLECMRKYGVEKYVLASTSSLYSGQKMPFDESLPVNQPISPYAASKKAAELMAYTYHFLYKIDVTVVRYFTVYGPAGRPDMSIFRFIRWIDEGREIELFGDGTQSRDFTYVDDIARGTIKALKPLGYEIINLGGGNTPVDMHTVIKKIEQHLGVKSKIKNQPFHVADMKSTWAKIDKANDLLGWHPEVSLDDGIEQAVLWYAANREFCRSLKI